MSKYCEAVREANTVLKAIQRWENKPETRESDEAVFEACLMYSEFVSDRTDGETVLALNIRPCRKHALGVIGWVCGDRMTRYRLFTAPGNTYFVPDDGIYTALGIKDAESFLRGYGSGMERA